MKEDQRRFRTPQAAKYCGISPRTLEKLRLIGGGHIFIRLGRACVYDSHDLDAWLSAHRRRSTSDTGEVA